MRKTISKTLLLSAMLISLSSTWLVAQNDTPTCYAPLVGTGKTATAIINSAVCVGTACNAITNVDRITDVDTTNFGNFSSGASVIASNGVTVRDAVNTYPAGYIAGYVLDLGSTTLLDANVLSSFTISTYTGNSILQQTSTSASLASATAIGTSPGKVFLTFKTTSSFNEVRLTFNTGISAFTNFRIFYAVAFDPNCGFSEDNGRCGDQIGGASSVVTFNGGSLTNVLTSIANPGNIIDGNKNSFATITIPVATGLIGANPYVGVLHQQQIYAPNTTVGFVISRPSILTLDVLSNIRIQTYLFGVLQDDRPISSNSVATSALTSALTDIDDRTSISIVTTKQYNEVRLVLTRTASINIGTLRVYYAFDQPNTCSTCVETIVSGPNSPFPVAPVIVGARTGETGICAGINLAQAGRVVDADTTNFATYSFGNSAGVGCGFELSVRVVNIGTVVPAGTMTGFIISRVGGNLIGTNVLENTQIRLYRNNILRSTSTDANLLGLTVLSSASGDRDTISFRAPVDFDEVQIRIINPIGVNLLGNDAIRIYNAFVIRDADNDGIPNCQDQCATGNDAIDTDSDGLTDCLAIILPLTLNDFTAKAVNNKQVLLSWKTLNEVNTQQFTIERSSKSSTNPADWQTVGTIAAAGTVSGTRNYQLNDNQPANGINYYRLRTTDKDGKQSLSEIRQVNFKANGILLSAIYPNPVKRSGVVTIAVAETANYRLLDNTGRLVNAGKIPAGNSQLKIPATAGNYVLELFGSANSSNKEHHRIIVQ